MINLVWVRDLAGIKNTGLVDVFHAKLLFIFSHNLTISLVKWIAWKKSICKDFCFYIEEAVSVLKFIEPATRQRIGSSCCIFLTNEDYEEVEYLNCWRCSGACWCDGDCRESCGDPGSDSTTWLLLSLSETWHCTPSFPGCSQRSVQTENIWNKIYYLTDLLSPNKKYLTKIIYFWLEK